MKKFIKNSIAQFLVLVFTAQTLGATTMQLVTLWSSDHKQRVHVFFDEHGCDSTKDMLEKFEHLKKNLGAGSHRIDMLLEGPCRVPRGILRPALNMQLFGKIDFFESSEGRSEFPHLKVKDLLSFSSYDLHSRLQFAFDDLTKVMGHVRGEPVDEITEEAKKNIDLLVGQEGPISLAAIFGDHFASSVDISLDQLQEAFEQDSAAIRLMLNDPLLPAGLRDTFGKIISESEQPLASWKKTMVDCCGQDALKVPLLGLFMSEHGIRCSNLLSDTLRRFKILQKFSSIFWYECMPSPWDNFFGLGNFVELNAFSHIISEQSADTVAVFMGAAHAYFLCSFLKQMGYSEDLDLTIKPNEKVYTASSQEEADKEYSDPRSVSLPKEIYNVLNTDPAELRKMGIEVSAGSGAASSSGSSSSSLSDSLSSILSISSSSSSSSSGPSSSAIIDACTSTK
ncbi:hypothetical protein K2X40_02345 [Candidatus Babeliales bacterium]|nr:hypothetical protein [Candidatus Babeliales bacterium]